MRVPLSELMEKLGVDRELYPYETQPWYHYDSEQGITCSAEVRMGPGGDDIEAEIQFVKDEFEEGEFNPEPPPPPVPEDGEAGHNAEPVETIGSHYVNGIQQIYFMRAERVAEEEWSPKHLRIKGTDYTGEVYDWDKKGCDIFTACIQSINMGELPDIDQLAEANLQEDEKGGGRRGRIGRKSPKVKPGQLLGMGKKI